MDKHEQEIFFTFLETVMHTAQSAKMLNVNEQRAVVDFIRKKLTPDIDLKDWLRLEKNVFKYRDMINQHLLQGFMVATGHKMPEEFAKEMSSLIELDEKTRNTLKNVDINIIKTYLQDGENEQNESIKNLLKIVEALKRDVK